MKRAALIRAAAGSGVALLLGVAGAPTSRAATSTAPPPSPSATGQASPTLTLAQLKARCDDAVQRRLGTLDADLSFVSHSAELTSADRQTLQDQVTADQTGLRQLDATIQSDTTREQVRTDCARIVTGFRVYVLEDPKIHEVIAADGLTKVDATFEDLIPLLQDLINNSSEPPNIKEQAQTALNDLRAKVSASETSISRVSGSVIGLQPSGYPGNAVVLQSGAQNIHTSRDDLAGARVDVAAILRLLGQ